MSEERELLKALEGVLIAVAPSECPRWLGELERLRALLWQRLLGSAASACATATSSAQVRLLTIP